MNMVVSLDRESLGGGSMPIKRQWGGYMITPLADQGEGGPASFVASNFRLDVAPGTAMLHVSALGTYRAFINGQRVGSDILTPGWTCYDDRVAYQSYDIAALLQAGENRIEIWIADGWFRSQILWSDMTFGNCWGARLGAIADIEVDGEVVLGTHRGWSSGLLPIRKSQIYYGEDYDARLEGVQAVAGTELLSFDTTLLVPHETDPVRELSPLAPIDSWRDAKGRRVFDFGQNCSGQIRIIVTGSSGAEVLIEHSEVLAPGRIFDNRNYRKAEARARYILRGDARESWQPAFTFMGYRYARITIAGHAELVDIVSIPITSIRQPAAGFDCAVPAVNRLVENAIWSQRSNFIEVPMDCPQRDERLGWTGDAQVFAGAACWLADCERFLRKYLCDVRADQRPDGAIAHYSPDPTRLHPERFPGEYWAGSTGWGDAICTIPWQLYLHYGDRGVLEENFPAMLRWLDYLWSISDGPIIRPPAEWMVSGFSFGDWLQPTGDKAKPRPTIADDCAATLYHFISTQLTARVAQILGYDEEATRLDHRANAIRAAFAEEYISRTGRLANNDQTSYALAFLSNILSAEHRTAAARYFRQSVEDAGCVIGTGFIGTPALLPALVKLGFHDLAERVFLNRRTPGWLYQVEQGATTIWERWDAIAPDGTLHDPEMNSYNHYSYGSVCQWLFESVAGIAPDPEYPGFDRVIVDPVVLPRLGHVRAWHNCRHGRIEAGWTIENGYVVYSLVLPAGVTAYIPASNHRDELTLDGLPVDMTNDIFLSGSGRHLIKFRLREKLNLGSV